jgi:ribosomal protein S18 acetylase RimI-like enzyme
MPALTYRRIDLTLDGKRAFENYHSACVASFGTAGNCCSRSHYLKWLAERLEEFPDGNVIASLDGVFVGQLELQIPYGLKTGYINLFYITPAWRRFGMGRQLHSYAERYFRSWEATAVELHVSPNNTAAIAFYRSLGYRTVDCEPDDDRLRKMRWDFETRRT